MPEEGYEQVHLDKKVFPIYPRTPAVSLEAIRGVSEHSFRYVDAQIWATARLNQISVVRSEDFPGGATIEGVTFETPFAEEYDLTEL